MVDMRPVAPPVVNLPALVVPHVVTSISSAEVYVYVSRFRSMIDLVKV